MARKKQNIWLVSPWLTTFAMFGHCRHDSFGPPTPGSVTHPTALPDRIRACSNLSHPVEYIF
jgi:hypothetical protein